MPRLSLILARDGRPLPGARVTFADVPDVDVVADVRGVVEVDVPHARLRGVATLADGTELPFDLVNAPGLRRVRVALSGNEETIEDPVLAAAMPSGRYEPLAVLGSGAMGRVIKARDAQLDRLVAIKLLRGDMVATEEDRQFFVTEGRSLARLKHPHLLAVYDLGMNDGAPYLVVEYVDGPDLEKVVLTNGPLPWRSICAAGVQIGQALDALHQAALVHRDVKPSNGLVDATGHVVLADFGLVKPLGDLADPRSRIFGTPAYMSPEHLQGLGLGPATDVYSLGATLHHLAAGATPFTGASMIVDIVRKSPPDLRKARTGVPDEIAALVLDCMAKAPEDRPSASEVVERFSAIEADLPDEPIGPFLPRVDRRATTGRRMARTESGSTAIRMPVASVSPTLESEPLPVTALHPVANETESARPSSVAQAVAASNEVSTSQGTSASLPVPGARRRWGVIATASAAFGAIGALAFALTRPPTEPVIPPTPVPSEAPDAPAPEPASPTALAEPEEAAAPALEGTGVPALTAVPLPDVVPSPSEGSAMPQDPSDDPEQERAAVEPPPRDRDDESRSERRDEEREEERREAEERREEEPERDPSPPETADDEGEVETAARTAPEPDASGDGVGEDAVSENGPGTDEDTSPPVAPEAAPAPAEPVATPPPVAAPVVEPVPVAPTPTPEAPALTAPTDEDDDGAEGRRRRGDSDEPTEPREREPPVPPMGF